MKVELINCTSDALDLLLMTKNTRLANDDNPANWSQDKKISELAYMRDTIKSSWAFINYTFRISGVTRAFTHQFIRSEGSIYPEGEFAQESQRTVDVSDSAVIRPECFHENGIWDKAVEAMMEAYSTLVKLGFPIQDARGLLPTNVTTSIVAQKSLRQLHFDSLQRLCVRTQGEHQQVFRLMREEILKVHPFLEDFMQVECVSSGTCAFPRYGKKECPIYDPAMDLTELKNKTKTKFWSSPIHVANPKAKDGRSM